jgi:hypothetical protein
MTISYQSPEQETPSITALGQSFNSPKTESEAVYDMNLALAESLDEMKSQDEKYKKRERFWRNGGPVLALAPLVAAGALIASPIGNKMETNEKIGFDIYALVGSLTLGITALCRFDKNRDKGQDLATNAQPISQTLNGSTQAWIARRLAEKEEDVRKQKERFKRSI